MQKGSKHNPESVQVIKDKTKKRWESLPSEKRSEIMKRAAETRIKNKEQKYVV